MTLRRILSCLLLLLPWLAQAGDGADFAAASRTQQAKLLQQWAAAPDASRLPLLQALRNENAGYRPEANTPFSTTGPTSVS